MAETSVSKQENNEKEEDETNDMTSGSDTSTGVSPSTCGETLSRRNHNDEPVSPRLNSGNELKKTAPGVDYTSQTDFLKMQSAMAAQEAFMRAGGYDMRAYYGWLPGIAPVRFPAFFYPSSFIGFPSNIAFPKQDGNVVSQRDDQWNGNKGDAMVNHKVLEHNDYVQQEHNSVASGQKGLTTGFAKPCENSNSFRKDIVSDEDEGLVLEESDSKNLKRTTKHFEQEKFQPQRRVNTVSVIQENCSFQAPTENSQNAAPSEKTKTEEFTKESPKRGRASNRQIEKTEQYWDRRKKNNMSAKKSRDARRQREIMTNQRSAMLEAENLRLRAELATLRDENERLKKELGNVTSA